MRYIGVDLAWGAGTATRRANETGVAVLDEEGRILDADWLRGIDGVADWILDAAVPGSLIAIDAPLVVHNPSGMRECEREVGRAYGRWRVSANASNTGLRWLAGVTLRERLETAGLVYVDGTEPPDPAGRSFFECYPYTTIVGTEELGYDLERPRYKRLTRGIPAAEGRAIRAVAFDELIRRVAGLRDAVPPLDLASHPGTRVLLELPPTTVAADHKHREDLLDAVLCAWTAAIWHVHGEERVQVLGRFSEPDPAGRRATIVAPARPQQRLDRRAEIMVREPATPGRRERLDRR